MQYRTLGKTGIDVGLDEAKYNPPAISRAELRRRPITDRAAV